MDKQKTKKKELPDPVFFNPEEKGRKRRHEDVVYDEDDDVVLNKPTHLVSKIREANTLKKSLPLTVDEARESINHEKIANSAFNMEDEETFFQEPHIQKRENGYHIPEPYSGIEYSFSFGQFSSKQKVSYFESVGDKLIPSEDHFRLENATVPVVVFANIRPSQTDVYDPRRFRRIYHKLYRKGTIEGRQLV